MENRINRRQLLVGGGAGSLVLAGLAVPTISAAASGANSHNDSLEGGWLITRADSTPSPSGPIQAVLSFAAGGAFATHDHNPAGPPGFGAWERQEHNRFVFTFYIGFPGNGGPGTTGFFAKVIANGTQAGQDMSGTYTVQGFDSKGNSVFSGTGSFTGTRIEAGK